MSLIVSDSSVSFPDSQSVEECGERTKRILESPSVPQANHQLLAHVTRHLARVALAQSGQHSQASPRLLGQAFSGLLFKPTLFRYWLHTTAHSYVEVLDVC